MCKVCKAGLTAAKIRLPFNLRIKPFEPMETLSRLPSRTGWVRRATTPHACHRAYVSVCLCGWVSASGETQAKAFTDFSIALGTGLACLE
jgi:hypothetical protein